jgi:preprotein translocase subunit SecA
MLKIPDDVPIENKRVTNAIANAQGQVESQNFESRKNVLKYDDVMDRQRKVIYGERREVLEGVNLEEQIRTFIDDVVTGFVSSSLDEFSEEWDLEQLWTDLKQFWPVSISWKDLVEDAGSQAALEKSALIEALRADAHAAYDAREEEMGEEVMRELERRVLLSVLDRKWREHLYEMDYLREGIYLRAYSQRDPLVEYQREGFDMFAAMMDGIKEETVGFLFNLEVQVEEDDDEGEEEEEFHWHPDGTRHAGPMHEGALAEPPVRLPSSPKVTAKGLDRPAVPTNLTYTAPDETGHEETRGSGPAGGSGGGEYAGTTQNALCPCGSGKKYKRCHGAPGGPKGTVRVG